MPLTPTISCKIANLGVHGIRLLFESLHRKANIPDERRLETTCWVRAQNQSEPLSDKETRLGRAGSHPSESPSKTGAFTHWSSCTQHCNGKSLIKSVHHMPLLAGTFSWRALLDMRAQWVCMGPQTGVVHMALQGSWSHNGQDVAMVSANAEIQGLENSLFQCFGCFHAASMHT